MPWKANKIIREVQQKAETHCSMCSYFRFPLLSQLRNHIWALQDIFAAGRSILNQQEEQARCAKHGFSYQPPAERSRSDGISCVRHMLSCDNDPAVLDWLKKTSGCQILMKDIENASDTFIHDEKTKSSKMLPKRTTISICGWVCHQASFS